MKPAFKRAVITFAASLGVMALAGAAAWLALTRDQRVITDASGIRAPASAARTRDVLWSPPQALPPWINAGSDALAPRLAPDGRALIFTRVSSAGDLDLFHSARSPTGWEAPKPLVDINTEADEIGAAISRDGSRLYFASNRGGGQGGFDIWVARRDAQGEWSAPARVDGGVSSRFNEYAPALSHDEATLYFSSDRPLDDAGDADAVAKDYDLFAVALTRAGAPASAPVALEALNSGANDAAPAPSPAGDFLYFASNRAGGAGGYDLLRARLVRGAFLPPEPLGAEINTPGDEIDPALGMDGFELLFSRSRGDAQAQAQAEAEAGKRDLHRAVSREVFVERVPVEARVEWSELLPWLLLLLLLALLLAALTAAGGAVGRERLRRLNLLAKCLIASLILHALLLLAFTVWQVSATLDQPGRAREGVQVALLSPAGAEAALSQVRGSLTSAAAQPASATPAQQARAAQPAFEPLARAETPTLGRDLTPRQALQTPAARDADAHQANAAAPAPSMEAAAAPTPPQAQPTTIAEQASPQARREAALAAQEAVSRPAQSAAAQAPSSPSTVDSSAADIAAQVEPSRAGEAAAPALARSTPRADAEDARAPAAAAPASAAERALTAATEQSVAPSAPSAPGAVAQAEPTPAVDARSRAGSAPRSAPAAIPTAGASEAVALAVQPGRSAEAAAPSSLAETAAADAQAALAPTEQPPAAAPASSELAVADAEPVAPSPPRDAAAPNAASQGDGESTIEIAAAPGSVASPARAPGVAAVDAGVALAAVQPNAPAAQAGAPQGAPAPAPRAGDAVEPASPAPTPDSRVAPSTLPLVVAPLANLPTETGAAEGASEASPQSQRSSLADALTAPSSRRADLADAGQAQGEAPATTSAALAQIAPARERTGAAEPAVSAAQRMSDATSNPPSDSGVPALEPGGGGVDLPPAARIAVSTPPVEAGPAQTARGAPSESSTSAFPSTRRAALAGAAEVAQAPAAVETLAVAPAPMEAADAPPTPARADRDAARPAPVQRLADVDAHAEASPARLAPSTPALAIAPAIPSEQAPIAEPYRQRAPERRQTLVERMGGSRETEEAVALALAWLAAQQAEDGRWDDALAFEDCEGCRRRTPLDSDVALTGLALLCFLGVDHTHMKDGPYRDVVSRGVDYLLSMQSATGDLRAGETMYSHGIASIALAEAYGMTKDPRLREPVERAVGFLVDARNRQAGGWRYEPGMVGDTSVLGWMVMAMVSARRGGIDVSEEAFVAARNWLERVSTERSSGLYAYQPGGPVTHSMTAEAMFAQQLLGRSRDEDRMAQSAEFLMSSLPDWRRRPATYYWYYATLALFQHQGEAWRRWNEALKDELVAAQRRDGEAAGSWDPRDRWSAIGGRVYQTALCALSLEVYYRYLPLFVTEDPGLENAAGPDAQGE